MIVKVLSVAISTLIAGIIAAIPPVAGIIWWILRNYFGQAGIQKQIAKKEKDYANLESLLAQAIDDGAPDIVLNDYSARLRMLHKEKTALSARLKKGLFSGS